MRKKIGTLLIIGSLGALCAGLAACSDGSAVDGYFKNGNVISVTYDASGGEIAGGTNIKLMDMFNPDKYEADDSGIVKIKLRNPTDPNRPKPGGDSIKVTNGENSLVGWYKTRETDENGAYTYSDPWDFEEDTVNLKKNESGLWNFVKDPVEFSKNEQEKLEFTLYAAWIPRYTFEYYYKKTADGAWEQFGSTAFNYLTATEEGKTMYVPAWGDSGKMEHAHGSFTFPSVPDKTFKAAYSDESCSTPITSLQHPGLLDRATAKAENTVQKIYVEFDEGNYYRISTAKQFVGIGDLSGHYTILSSELDFTDERWPNRLLSEEFKGTIESESGVVFKNVSAQYNLTSGAAYGGLFGKLGAGAEITNVNFENVTLTYKNAVNRRGGSFGLFAGEIDDGAIVENVKVSGEMQLWKMDITGGVGFNFNLTANGDKRSAVTNEGIKIKICGTAVTYGSYRGKYEFDIDPDAGKTTVDDDGNVTITALEDSNDPEKREKRIKDEKDYIVYGGKENE